MATRRSHKVLLLILFLGFFYFCVAKRNFILSSRLSKNLKFATQAKDYEQVRDTQTNQQQQIQSSSPKQVQNKQLQNKEQYYYKQIPSQLNDMDVTDPEYPWNVFVIVIVFFYTAVILADQVFAQFDKTQFLASNIQSSILIAVVLTFVTAVDLNVVIGLEDHDSLWQLYPVFDVSYSMLIILWTQMQTVQEEDSDFYAQLPNVRHQSTVFSWNHFSWYMWDLYMAMQRSQFVPLSVLVFLIINITAQSNLIYFQAGVYIWCAAALLTLIAPADQSQVMIVGSIAKFANNIFPKEETQNENNIDFKDLQKLASLDSRKQENFEWQSIFKMLIGDNPKIYAKINTIRCDTYCGIYKGDKGTYVNLTGSENQQLRVSKNAILMAAGIDKDWYVYLQKLIKAGILQNQSLCFMSQDLMLKQNEDEKQAYQLQTSQASILEGQYFENLYFSALQLGYEQADQQNTYNGDLKELKIQSGDNKEKAQIQDDIQNTIDGSQHQIEGGTGRYDIIFEYHPFQYDSKKFESLWKYQNEDVRQEQQELINKVVLYMNQLAIKKGKNGIHLLPDQLKLFDNMYKGILEETNKNISALELLRSDMLDFSLQIKIQNKYIEVSSKNAFDMLSRVKGNLEARISMQFKDDLVPLFIQALNQYQNIPGQIYLVSFFITNIYEQINAKFKALMTDIMDIYFIMQKDVDEYDLKSQIKPIVLILKLNQYINFRYVLFNKLFRRLVNVLNIENIGECDLYEISLLSQLLYSNLEFDIQVKGVDSQEVLGVFQNSDSTQSVFDEIYVQLLGFQMRQSDMSLLDQLVISKLPINQDLYNNLQFDQQSMDLRTLSDNFWSPEQYSKEFKKHYDDFYQKGIQKYFVQRVIILTILPILLLIQGIFFPSIWFSANPNEIFKHVQLLNIALFFMLICRILVGFFCMYQKQTPLENVKYLLDNFDGDTRSSYFSPQQFKQFLYQQFQSQFMLFYNIGQWYKEGQLAK